MKALFHLAAEIQDICISKSWPFCFIEAVTLRTCSAEDLIIYKAFADRNREWADIEGILVRQKGKLDWSHIEKYLLPLSELKEIPHVISKLNDLRSSLA